MNAIALIDKYYAEQPALREILISHSLDVRDLALDVAHRHPELMLDETFLAEAAMLHDIGIFLTDAAGIQCFGTEPYIRHGLLGGQLLRSEGLERHARVAERHTGTGLTVATITAQGLPLPLQDWSPETLEEQVICYADKFFSKSRLGLCKPYEKVLVSMSRFGEESEQRFRQWHERFS